MYKKQQSTLSFFKCFIILQNFFCINRSFLIKGKTQKKICFFIFGSTLSFLIGAMIFDIFIQGIKYDYSQIGLNLLSVAEFLVLINHSSRKKTFESLERLDEKCGISGEYCKQLKRNLRLATFENVLSIIINIGFILLQKTALSTAVIFGVATSAHDSEMMFIKLIIETFNVRLLELKDVSSSVGSRVYRHLLLSSATVGEEFGARITVMLLAMLIKTIIYIVLAALFNKDVCIVAILIGCQLRSLYGLYNLCLAASTTKTICNRLVFDLATKVVLDPRVNKVYNRRQNAIMRRWHLSVRRERPRYLSGAIESITLNIPITIFDSTINYLLIIIQVYAAYK